MPDPITFKLEDKAFSAALRKFYVEFAGDLGKIVRAQARLVAANLTFQTQPFGGSRPTPGKQADEQTTGLKLGEGAITRDLNDIYTTPRRVYYLIKEHSDAAAKGFMRLMTERKFLQAQALLDRLQVTGLRGVTASDFDGGAAHKFLLRPIPGRPRIKKNQKPVAIVPDQKVIDRYAKEVHKRVGIAKAGWASCAQQLGGTAGQTATDVAGKQQVMIPRWVKRHIAGRANGTVNDQSRARASAFVTMTNTVPWIDKCLSAGQMQAALDIQREKMETAIKKAEEYRSRKFEQKLLGF